MPTKTHTSFYNHILSLGGGSFFPRGCFAALSQGLVIFSCSSLETMGFAQLFPTARLRLQEFLQEQKCEQVLKTGCISGVRRKFRDNLFCNLKQLSLQDFKRIGVSDTTGSGSWLGLLGTQPHMSSPCSSAWTEVEGNFLVNALTRATVLPLPGRTVSQYFWCHSVVQVRAYWSVIPILNP